MEPRRCERSEAIQGRHTQSLRAKRSNPGPTHAVIASEAKQSRADTRSHCERSEALQGRHTRSLRAKRSNPGPTHALSGSLRRFAPRDDAVSRLARLANPGFPGEPFVIRLAD